MAFSGLIVLTRAQTTGRS